MTLTQSFLDVVISDNEGSELADIVVASACMKDLPESLVVSSDLDDSVDARRALKKRQVGPHFHTVGCYICSNLFCVVTKLYSCRFQGSVCRRNRLLLQPEFRRRQLATTGPCAFPSSLPPPPATQSGSCVPDASFSYKPKILSHEAVRSSHQLKSASIVTRCTSHFTLHTSNVTRNTSHVTRHTSHVPRHQTPLLHWLLLNIYCR